LNNIFFISIRSPQDSRLHIVKDDLPQEDMSEAISAFDQLNLFDNSNDIMKRIVNSKKFYFLMFLFLNIFREDHILVGQLLNDFLK
jgi:Asp-tRNA(Asn)/Glu-tRNA(Gln) amidotransferase C subunit